MITTPATLPRRRPGTHMPTGVTATRFVGRAPLPAGVTRWSDDLPTLARLLHLLRDV